jgi:hypothetical protein
MVCTREKGFGGMENLCFKKNKYRNALSNSSMRKEDEKHHNI